MIRTSDLDFDLPEGRIATHPAQPRDAAKLLVVSRSDDRFMHEATIRELPRFIKTGDVLVRNTTRVLPARVEGARIDTKGKIGGLFVRSATTADGLPEGKRGWIVLLHGKSVRAGIDIRLSSPGGQESKVVLHLLRRFEYETGGWLATVPELDKTDEQLLEAVGHTPLPPYILKARKHAELKIDDARDRADYQTLFAKSGGSVAAPTAGLHLTDEVSAALLERGAAFADVVLHVGTGTFRSVTTEYVEQHEMHTEWCAIPIATHRAMMEARQAGHRVLTIGTTSARTVETFGTDPMAAGGRLAGDTYIRETDILITPGYSWQMTDGMLTNFHLPRSTLLAMVASLFPGGIERLKAIYAHAIAREYRFFSYGDAMLIIP